MRKGNSLKTMVFFLGLAAMLIPAKTLSAQDRPGGILGTNVSIEQSNSGLIGHRSQGGHFSIYPQQFFGDENGGYAIHHGTFVDVTPDTSGPGAPLGSGLFIMAAAGAGYALKKRKDNKKQ